MAERYAAAAPELPLLFAYYALAYHCAYRADAATLRRRMKKKKKKN